jgi:hypothetical protein
MYDSAPPVTRDVLDHAWQSAQRLTADVIEYPAEKRDEVMPRMGVMLAEIAREAGCTHEMALSLAPRWSKPFVSRL